MEPAEPVALSPVDNSSEPDAEVAGEVTNAIDPDWTPWPLAIRTSPPDSTESVVDPADKVKSPPRPKPLLPTLISIPPADDCSLEPLRILIAPDDPLRESPVTTSTLPEEVVSTPSTVSANDDEEMEIEPVDSGVLADTANRRD
jgi:hypothetical protein